MRTVKCQNLDDAIKKLQQQIDQDWHSSSRFTEAGRRRWLKAVPQDSYGEEEYRVELWVLEGSPVKQIVIINHFMKQIHCHDCTLRKEVRFVWGEQMYG